MVKDEKPLQQFLDTVATHRQFMPRSKAEVNPNFYQPIPCAVVTYGERILFLRRKKKDHTLQDTYAVWAGGHVVQ
jgi:predicted NUDIX family phosphoesterase